MLNILPRCPFCGQEFVVLYHLTTKCDISVDLRVVILSELLTSGAVFHWALSGNSPTEADAILKLNLVGITTARTARALELETV